MRIDLRRIARRLQEVIRRARIVPRRLPQQRQFIGHARAAFAVTAFQRLRHVAAERGLAGARKVA